MSSAAPAKQRFSALSPGKTVAERYLVTRVLGQGGMGQVVEVEHVALGRRFALKVLRLERWNDELVRRFNREARALGSLSTARVAQVTDFGVDEQAGPFYVMELLEGETLEDRLEREEKVPAREALHICAELCEALADVHDAGLVHRDLKPSNVGLPNAGPVLVKLLDFGLAASMDDAFLSKITQSQQILGSLPYMAPEQFNGAAPALTMDLYAVGIVLYESITGRLPFMAPSAAAMIHQILMQPMPPIGPDGAGLPHLEALLERFLAKEPTARFASAKAAAQAIRDVLGRDAPPMTRVGMRPHVPSTGGMEVSTRRSLGQMPTMMAESGTRLSGTGEAPEAPPTLPSPVGPSPHMVTPPIGASLLPSSPPAPSAVPPTPLQGTIPMSALPAAALATPAPESSVQVYSPYATPYPVSYPGTTAAVPTPSGPNWPVRIALAVIVGIVFAGLTAVVVAVGLSLLDGGSRPRERPVATQPAVVQPVAPSATSASPPRCRTRPRPEATLPSAPPVEVAPTPEQAPAEVKSPPRPTYEAPDGRLVGVVATRQRDPAHSGPSDPHAAARATTTSPQTRPTAGDPLIRRF
ncbi:MAG: protein kinase [Sandaracinaceae bacterium]